MEGNNEEKRLRQALRGRINQAGAEKLLEEFGSAEAALDFVLTGEPEHVEFYLRQNPSYVQELSAEADAVAKELQEGPENTVRQFACKDCMRSWWRRVPTRKMVSTCHRCHQKYECIPRDKEWGCGIFHCECGNNFMGFAVMKVTQKCCDFCRKLVFAHQILPPRKDTPQKVSSVPNECRIRLIHDNIRYASKKHESTGSTVTTFMTGGSVDTASVGEFCPMLDISDSEED